MRTSFLTPRDHSVVAFEGTAMVVKAVHPDDNIGVLPSWLTHIATTVNASLCTPTKRSPRFWNWKQGFEVAAISLDEQARFFKTQRR
jgi:hypothetical protein